MAITQFGRRILGAKWVQGVNEAEILSLFTDHQITDACTVTLGTPSGGILPIFHTYPSGSPMPFSAVSNGDWLIVDNSLDLKYGGLSDAIVQSMFRTMGQSATAIAATPEFAAAAVAASPSLRAAREVPIPAAASLTPGTRTVAFTWPTPLPAVPTRVDILPDSTLRVGNPYAFAIAASPAPTVNGATLQYTNASTLVTLGAGTVDLFAYL